MGQLQSQEFAIYPSSYTFVKEIYQHPYGQGRILQNISKNEKIFQIYIESFTLEETKKSIEKIQDLYKNLKHPQILQFLNWNEEDTTLIPGNYGRFSLYYEYCSYTLADQIQLKKQQRGRFSEGEILYLLNTLINVCHFLQTNQMSHKDLKPQNILINSENQLKLVPAGCFPYDMDAVKKQKYLHQHQYLPPEVQKKLMKIDKIDWNQCDIYAAGLTLLDAVSLNFSYDIIETTNDNRKQDIIKNRILTCRPFYSPGLLMIINKMLETNPIKRLRLQDLFQFFLPYQNDILNLQKINLPIQFNFQQPASFKLYQPKCQLNLQVSPSQGRQTVFSQKLIKILDRKIVHPSPLKKTISQNSSIIIQQLSPNQSPMRSPFSLSRTTSQYQINDSKNFPVSGSPMSTQLSFQNYMRQQNQYSRQASPLISQRRQDAIPNLVFSNQNRSKQSITEQLRLIQLQFNPQNTTRNQQENQSFYQTEKMKTADLVQQIDSNKLIGEKTKVLHKPQQSFDITSPLSNFSTNKNQNRDYKSILNIKELEDVDKLIDETILKSQSILKQFEQTQ